MKVLQIATSTNGGAGIAARRLNAALNTIGINSLLLSGSLTHLSINQNEIIVKKSFISRNLSRVLTAFQAKILQKRNFLMTTLSLEMITIEKILAHKPDIIHLHTFYNLLSTKTIAEICNSGIPTFISLHDERFYTGGCHHAMGCSQYQESCSNCPETRQIFKKLVVGAQHNLTVTFKNNQTLTVIAPSEWISRRAKSSSALKFVEVVKVNNPVSLDFIEKSKNLRKPKNPSKPYLVTFVAQDLYSSFKGITTLLQCISQNESEFAKQNIKFVFVGSGPEVQIGNLKSRQYEKIESLNIADIYSESDLLIVPSLIDNSPNVIFEALVCGTPFVGSNQGGIPEIAEVFGMETFVYGDPDSMYGAIIKQKNARLDSNLIRENALALVHPELVAKKISKLYLSKLTSAN